ncbi:PREDICTED: putative leucine-rich repeat-containing protein DDB_G0290503 [Ceratosolen solmsi marchali]|uniref:Leucine-rich repeat-containing protein DDB_G0290503 n=1 Tax=Ceratosolen solmsi marchali TaxID=326594 RepID=A0AAJ7DXP9_9HYME|nr:PREDICTED: putative leucine-rich repeat-containing protein DDB_G0290503 [Ceratosolen solmsi marchali]
MSFIDYGFEIFSLSPDYQKNVYELGDYIVDKNFWNSTVLKNACQDDVINHLISLGSCAEKELDIVRKELHGYQSLKLTNEQFNQLRNIKFDYVNAESDKLIKCSNLDSNCSSLVVDTVNQNQTDGENAFEEGSSKSFNVSNRQLYSNATKLALGPSTQLMSYKKPTLIQFRNKYLDHHWLKSSNIPVENIGMTIVQESEIMLLKNENAEKEMVLNQFQKQNKQLEEYIEQLKSKYKKVENTSQMYKVQIDDIIRQKNKELRVAEENNERLDRELKDVLESKKVDADEIAKLQAIVNNTEISRTNLIDKLKMMKQRLEILESKNMTQTTMIKKLHQDYANLEKQNEKESEIERLLNIIQRLNKKYDKSKVHVEVNESKMLECREQLTSMEREVGKLIVDLAECLGPTESCDIGYLEKSMWDETKAIELSRGFAKIVREHEKCRENRIELLNEIERLAAINRANAGISKIKLDLHEEITRMKEIIENSGSILKLKSETKKIFETLTLLLNTNKNEKSEKTNADVEPDNADKKSNDSMDYKKFENLLLPEFEKMQKALSDVEITLKGQGDCNSGAISENAKQKEATKSEKSHHNEVLIKGGLSTKIVDNIQNCKEFILRIMNIARDVQLTLILEFPILESEFKVKYKELKDQLQTTLKSHNKTIADKNNLQKQYDDSQKQCKEVAREIEKLEQSLNEKSNDLLSLNTKMQSSFECYQKEKEILQNQIVDAEFKFQQSVTEVVNMTKANDSLIGNLKEELEINKTKLCEYEAMNEILTVKLKNFDEMIQKLQAIIMQKNNIDINKIIINQNEIKELIKYKNDLMEKNANLHSQLLNLERSDLSMESNLNKMLQDNQYLEVCINYMKNENEDLVSKIDKQECPNINLGVKCNELLEKVEKISKQQSKQIQKCPNTDAAIREMKKEIKSQKDKIDNQQKDLLMKAKEIDDKNKSIEMLSNRLNQLKTSNGMDNTLYVKQIETLSNQKMKLENELKQTLMKHEDKLAEMQKQYNHIEIELHKNHNDSTRHLETKYMEMMKDGKTFTSPTWLQSLKPNELQELHHRICKTPLCSTNTYENKLIEDATKRNWNKNDIATYKNKGLISNKQELRTVRISSTNDMRFHNRQSCTPEKMLNNRSLVMSKK